MKVLHVNHSDSQGGASRAAFRIHHAQVASGIDSRMIVLRRGTDDDRVTQAGSLPLTSRILQMLHHRWLAQLQRNWHSENPILHTFGQDGAGLVDRLNASDADVLNLHWISGMLSVTDIGRLNKPIVWTLHDMWAFCGGEHYTLDSETARFRVGYRADNRPPGEGGPDLNRKTWEVKRRAWKHQRITIISPSNWLAECAGHSALFKNTPLQVIPYSLDTATSWRPIPREVARAALSLPSDKLLILMGADGGVADPRKGGDLLRDAVARAAMQLPRKVELMIYGQGQQENTDVWPCPVHWLGRIYDDRVLALAYSAADLMAVPSRQDNLPNAALEAQSCGIPVIAFSVGGLSDIVAHGETGWLAKPFDTDDLAKGIVWILADDARHAALSQVARKRAVERYSEAVVSKQYAQLYEQVLADRM